MNLQNSDVTCEDAKKYLARKDLFQIFESLLTALLYRRPEDPLHYIEMCMKQAKQSESLMWDSFLDVDLSEAGQLHLVTDQLKSDVKDAYGKIFKTEPNQIKK